MKYHEYSNLQYYKEAKEKGLTSRDEVFGGASFSDRYMNHEIRFLFEKVKIPTNASICIIGVGTGSDACWLSEKGYSVTGIDIVQDALDIANSIAEQRGLKVEYIKDDITNPKMKYDQFDLIIDSFCLQSIVMDSDRYQVLKFVKNHLKKNGKYIIITAGYSDKKTYNTDSYREAESGIVYERIDQKKDGLTEYTTINNKLYIPVRRHHTISSLSNELLENNFKICYSHVDQKIGDLYVITEY